MVVISTALEITARTDRFAVSVQRVQNTPVGPYFGAIIINLQARQNDMEGGEGVHCEFTEDSWKAA